MNNIRTVLTYVFFACLLMVSFKMEAQVRYFFDTTGNVTRMSDFSYSAKLDFLQLDGYIDAGSQIVQISETFRPKPGFGLSGGIDFPINEKFHIELGFGVSRSGFLRHQIPEGISSASFGNNLTEADFVYGTYQGYWPPLTDDYVNSKWMNKQLVYFHEDLSKLPDVIRMSEINYFSFSFPVTVRFKLSEKWGAGLGLISSIISVDTRYIDVEHFFNERNSIINEGREYEWNDLSVGEFRNYVSPNVLFNSYILKGECSMMYKLKENLHILAAYQQCFSPLYHNIKKAYPGTLKLGLRMSMKRKGRLKKKKPEPTEYPGLKYF